MPKQLGKGIDKEAMFKKIMPSASKSQNTAAAFNPDADGFSDSSPRLQRGDSLDLDGDFGSLDMLDNLGSFDALDSFDLFDEPAAPNKSAPKKSTAQKAAKTPAAKSVTKSPTAKTPTKAAAKSAGNQQQDSLNQPSAASVRGRAPLPFPINTTAAMPAPAAPTASFMPDELDQPPFIAQQEIEPLVSNKPQLPFPINTTAPMPAPAAPTAPVPPPAVVDMHELSTEGYQIGTQFDLLDELIDAPANYAIPGGALPPRAPNPIQPQAIQQPGLPASQPPVMTQPMLPQEIMAQAQQQMMQQMQQMQAQMQQQMEQQMRQQLEQQMMLQQQLGQQMLSASPNLMPVTPASALPQSDSVSVQQPVASSAAQATPQPAVEKTAIPVAAPIETASAVPEIDPLALIPVNLTAMLLNPRLEEMIERMHACKCEQCKTDAAAFALNQLPVRYTLSGQVSEEDLFNRASVSQVVSALCHAVLFVKSHPRH